MSVPLFNTRSVDTCVGVVVGTLRTPYVCLLDGIIMGGVSMCHCAISNLAVILLTLFTH